ncbi:Omega-amidase YafV [Polaribacter huanghezhanensis]|uniref:amidohydrolase n=1 Tax=Polaribacter huanghezhanensis TaxID=1354726 RepID=UPI0026474DED|nr:amidohydrolase [Polaribacter huanghezhanensis]WKD85177.1 Omega-amidase YafV [Polaribacter huanghezhanensis]
MQTDLQIAIIQKDLVWENAIKNKAKLDVLLEDIQNVDVIILPEMFTTGFSMVPKPLAEDMNGETVDWMQQKAAHFDAAVVGSIIINNKGRYYNRMLFVHPKGKIETYDKRHTFTLAGEHKAYTSGKNKLIVDYKGWKICPLICYDLRFPVWSRNVEEYDLLIYVANWPIPRINAWKTLLKARAIENMSYCIGVNRVGVDTNGYEYNGNSMAIDFLGNELTEVVENEEKIIYATLSKNKLRNVRTKLPFLEDKDQFTIH